MERKNIDKNVSLLFWRLIKTTPALIKDRKLIYNLRGDIIKIWWTVKTEKNLELPICSDYNIEPFNRKNIHNESLFWEFDNSPESDGYTFFINTPVCQFKVPELSRMELTTVQNLIDGYFENFIPRYLDSLLDVQESNYGKVRAEDNYSNLVAY